MFRTEIHIPKSTGLIHLDDEIISIGSCFSDTIGSRLLDHKFQITRNPFGTIFNPVSLCHLLDASLHSVQVKPDELIQNGEIYYHFDLHSDFSDTSASELVHRINQRRKSVGEKLRNSKWLILTLGTAWVYERKENSQLVANCHKLPAENFSKRLLSVEEIKSRLEQTLSELIEENPSIKILFTLSPVRHSRDGMEANQISKSKLRLAIHDLVNDSEQNYYFPAFELLLDDLRDYRFYAKDLVHPSEEAIDYIWQKFIDSYVDEEGLEFIKKWKKIKSALEHKPFHPNTSAHQEFLERTLGELQQLSSKVDVSLETDHLKKQMING